MRANFVADSLLGFRPKSRRTLLELSTLPTRMHLHPCLFSSSGIRPSSCGLPWYAKYGCWTRWASATNDVPTGNSTLWSSWSTIRPYSSSTKLSIRIPRPFSHRILRFVFGRPRVSASSRSIPKAPTTRTTSFNPSSTNPWSASIYTY